MISQILIVMIAAIAVTIFAERRNIQPPLLLALAGLLASFIPGLSRLELDPEIILTVVLPPLLFSAATEFSFFLAIPTMFAATAYDLYKNWTLLRVEDLPVFAVGFVASFVAAMWAVKSFIRFISNHTFIIFAWYRIAFGLFVLATWYFGWVEWSEA